MRETTAASAAETIELRYIEQISAYLSNILHIQPCVETIVVTPYSSELLSYFTCITWSHISFHDWV
jgi:hypothetical protein